MSSLWAGSTSLAREQHAVSKGIGAFEASVGVRGTADYVLRRNVHRLEKGLISRPRREVFATSYIQETVEHLEQHQRQAGAVVDGAEAAWALDVLAEFFRSTGSAPELDAARARFVRAFGTRSPSKDRLVPFVRELGDAPPVSYEALLDLSIRRRSVRWFEQRPIPRDLIDAALAVGAQAPSACNRQPFEFMVFDEPERVRRVVSIPGGTAGFEANIPVIVALIGRLDAFFSERDRHIIYIDASLAAMAFMLALETLGLSSCAINTPGEEEMERRMGEELGLRPFERPVMLIALGYPDRAARVPRSQKKPLDDLRRYNP